MSEQGYSEKNQSWRDVLHLLRVTFGEQNIVDKPDVIRVSLDPLDSNQQHLFFMLTDVIGGSFLEDTNYQPPQLVGKIWIPAQQDGVDIRIPKEQNVEVLLEKLKETFGNQRRSKDGTKVELHLQRDQSVFVYDLENLTGQSWRHVLGSKYGRPVLEPVLKERPSAQQRRDQEILLAEAVVPTRPKLEAKNWIEHQEAVEDRTGTAPRTAMPADLLSSSMRSKLNLNSHREGLKQDLQDVFRDRGR